ncbi:MAG: helix-turn-helix transcriptional regulator [Oscillospiraceae bacterium]|nr:helix-turn-helix transcriptional regulator [Oscillospiraceae bacterium]
MSSSFSRTLSLLRQEKGISQRVAAGDLGISQALLSHYENGIREPGLAFVTRACDYYNVSADFLLGRTMSRDGATIDPEELYDVSEDKDNVLRGSVMATLNKKLLVNSIGLLFDLLGRLGSREAIVTASSYLGAGIYRVFRHLYRSNPHNSEDFFSVPTAAFLAGTANADMIYCEYEFTQALHAHAKEKRPFPELNNDVLKQNYPVLYQSLLQIIHTTGERINKSLDAHKSGK